MGKTSSAVKNRYNAKAYDQLPIRVPKGMREVYKACAEARGKSLNAFVVDLIDADMERNASPELIALRDSLRSKQSAE